MADLTPEQVASREFRNTFRGYDPDEVRTFLATLAESLGLLLEEHARLAAVPGVELRSEIDTATREIGELLHSARETAEAMRERAGADSARWRAEALSEAQQTRSIAEQDAVALRSDAWTTSEQLLDQTQAEAARIRERAEADALRIVGEAEREAHRLTANSRREADDTLRAARMEAEQLVVRARAEHDDIISSAIKQSEAAQERTRALERRREELMRELDQVRSSLNEVEGEVDQRRETLGLTPATEPTVPEPAPETVARQEAEPDEDEPPGGWVPGETVRVVKRNKQPEPGEVVSPDVQPDVRVVSAAEMARRQDPHSSEPEDSDPAGSDPASPGAAGSGPDQTSSEGSPLSHEADDDKPLGTMVRPAAPPDSGGAGEGRERPGGDRGDEVGAGDVERAGAMLGLEDDPPSRKAPDARGGESPHEQPPSEQPPSEQSPSEQSPPEESPPEESPPEESPSEPGSPPERSSRPPPAPSGGTERPDLRVVPDSKPLPSSVREGGRGAAPRRVDSPARTQSAPRIVAAADVTERSADDSHESRAGSDASGRQSFEELAGLFQRLRTDDEAGEPTTGAAGSPSRRGNRSRSDPFELRDRLLLPVGNRALRSLKRQLTEEQNLVLEEIRLDEGDWAPDVASIHERVRADLVVLHAESFGAGHAGAIELLGSRGPRPATPRLDLAQGFAEALGAELGHALSEGRTLGQGARQLGASMSRVFRAWRTDQAERRVREIALGAYHDGLARTAELSGVTELIWVVGGRGCATCRARAEEPFSGIPPAHAGCECTVVP